MRLGGGSIWEGGVGRLKLTWGMSWAAKEVQSSLGGACVGAWEGAREAWQGVEFCAGGHGEDAWGHKGDCAREHGKPKGVREAWQGSGRGCGGAREMRGYARGMQGYKGGVERAKEGG